MVDQTDEYGGRQDAVLLSARPRGPSALRSRRRGLRLRRLVFGLFTFLLTIGMVVAAGVAYFFLRPSHEPFAVSLESQVETALSARVKSGLHFLVGGTDIDWVDGQPALVVRQLMVKDDAGHQIIKAPRAVLAVDPLRLMTGTIVPTRLDLRDLTVRLTVLADGSLAFAAGTDETLPFRVADAFESAVPGPNPSVAAGQVPQGPGRPQPDVLRQIGLTLGVFIDRLTGGADGFGGFDRLGIKGGTFVLDDRSHNAVTAFRNIDFDFDRIGEGATRLALAADGAAGRWSVSVRGVRHPDARRTLAIDVQNVTLSELQAMPALNAPGFTTDLPMFVSVDVGLDPSGDLAVARGQIRAGSGFVRLNDPDHEPAMVDSMSSTFYFDPSAKKIVVEPSEINIETTHYQFQGNIEPPVSSLDRPWTVTAGGSGVYGVERPGEAPVALQAIKLNAQFDPGKRSLHIAELSLNGPQVALGLSADVQAADNRLSVKAKLRAGRMPAPVILRLWPNLISAPVHAWLLANVQGGMIEHGSATINLDNADFDKIKQQRSVADSHVQLDYAVSDLTLAFMQGLPPLHGVVGAGTVTGDTSAFKVSRAAMDLSPGHQLSLLDGGIFVPSTDPKPTPATIVAHVGGSVESLMDLLSRDALKSYANVPPDVSAAKGQVEGTLTLGLRLGERVRSEDLKIGVNAHLTALSIEKLIGKQGLTNGDLTIALDKTGLRAKGQASLFGASSAIDVRKPAGSDPGEANLVLTLDDAARAKAGFNMGRSVAGPITARIVTPLGSPDKKANIELDLTRATLNEPLPGLSKPNGKPGKVTLVAVQRDDGVDLNNIVCDIGAVSLRGSADLDKDGSLQGAHLTQAKLSPGDDMKADIAQSADVLKLTIRGVNIDARPYLKAMTSSDPPDPNSKDFDLDLHSNVLTGQNSQVLTGVDIRASRRNGQIKKLQVSGKFGRAPLNVTSTPQGAVTSLTARSADAGAALAFLDLYKRINGGQLDASVRMLDSHMDGFATVREFGLKEDPALKRLTEESLSQSKSGGDPHIDAANLTFTKLIVNFSKNGSKVDIKDGALYGPQMGATVQGTVDLARDRLSLSGTFVPIYGVNNLFAQLPVIGTLLGGGANEGLFGLNYRLNGSTENPNLTVDPLSALAPGFLRKIFGAISEAADQDAAPTPQQRPKTSLDPVAR